MAKIKQVWVRSAKRWMWKSSARMAKRLAAPCEEAKGARSFCRGAACPRVANTCKRAPWRGSPGRGGRGEPRLRLCRTSPLRLWPPPLIWVLLLWANWAKTSGGKLAKAASNSNSPMFCGGVSSSVESGESGGCSVSDGCSLSGGSGSSWGGSGVSAWGSCGSWACSGGASCSGGAGIWVARGVRHKRAARPKSWSCTSSLSRSAASTQAKRTQAKGPRRLAMPMACAIWVMACICSSFKRSVRKRLIMF